MATASQLKSLLDGLTQHLWQDSPLDRGAVSDGQIAAHAMALNDPGGGSTHTDSATCDATTRAIGKNMSAQWVVDFIFPQLRKPSDFKIPFDWTNMSDTEKDIQVAKINQVAPPTPNGLHFEACNIQWKPGFDKAKMTACATKGELWLAIVNNYI